MSSRLRRCGALAAHPLRQRHAVRHAGVLDGHEGDHVHRAQARVLAGVGAQVEVGQGHLEERHHRRLQCRLVSGQGEDAAVVVAVGLHVEDADAGRTQGGHGRLHDLRAAAFADVGNALDQAWHGGNYTVHP
jgi:hypothetical protein